MNTKSNLSRIIQQLASALPDIPSDVTLHRLGKGHHNECYFVETSARKLVVKTALAATPKGQSHLRSEFEALQQLHGTSHPILTTMAPRPICFIPSASDAGEILVMEFISGKPLHEQEFRTLPPTDITMLAKMLSALHSVESNYYTNPGDQTGHIGTHADAFMNMLHNTVDKPLAALDPTFEPDSQALAAAVHQRLIGHLHEYSPHFQGTTFSLTHGDFGPHNMLRRPDGTFLCLDWEGARKDDPARELSYIRVNHGLPAALFQHLLQAYSKDRDIDAHLLARIKLYDWLNRLDDLVWVLGKFQRDPAYRHAYEQRTEKLKSWHLLDTI